MHTMLTPAGLALARASLSTLGDAVSRGAALKPAGLGPSRHGATSKLTQPGPVTHFSGAAAAARRTAAHEARRGGDRSGSRSTPGFTIPEFLPSVAGLTPFASSSDSTAGLPAELLQLLDPSAGVDLPTPAAARRLDNRELDKLVAALGRSKATWRRALLLHEWLLSAGHAPDARLCTTLLRVCAQHGQAVTALGLYDWMRAPLAEGGAALSPTVYTYTAAMRAALAGGLAARALSVWDDAAAAGCEPDGRMCTTLVEVCTRVGDTARALAVYDAMQAAPPGSRLAPSVHAYTAAMRAAAEGGAPARALTIWDDMLAAGCRPTGHAYAAAISACASGGEWRRAVALFDEMLERSIKPDVVSCTALVSALGADGQWHHAERVVEWMLASGVRPNVRTYTALVTAMAGAREWERALDVLDRMKAPGGLGHVEPNAYTYSALLKVAGEQGQWQLAEGLFKELEAAALATDGTHGGPAARATAPTTPPATPPHPSASSSARHATPPGTSPPPAAPSPRMSLDLETAGSVGPYGRVALELAEQVLDSGGSGSLDGDVSGPAAAAATSPATPPATPVRAPPGRALTPPVSESDGLFGLAWPVGAASAAAADAAARDANPWAADAAGPLALLPADDLIDGAVVGDAGAAPWSPPAADAAGSSGTARGRAGARAPWHPRSALNEVVCGALMVAYERAGRCDDAVGVLDRARALGITPNVVMHNTALAALGRAGRVAEACALFDTMPVRDATSWETLIAAHGTVGDPATAEATLAAMVAAGHKPRDYAYCGLVVAHSTAGDLRSALGARARMEAAGLTPSVYVFNALLAACERARAWDAAVGVQAAMRRAGVRGDDATARLLQAVGRGGVESVEDTQRAAAALAAALAAAGGLLMRAGLF